MAQRAKKPVIVAPSEAEAHESMKAFAQASSKLKGIESEMELEVQKVRDKFTLRIEKTKVDYEHNLDLLKRYAEENRETLFSKKKSLNWTHGIIGFRTGTPKVTKPSKVTWDKVMEILKAEKLKRFIRIKAEINKDKIIESREDKVIMNQLKDLAGIEVIQQETFYVEPKEEEVQS